MTFNISLGGLSLNFRSRQEVRISFIIHRQIIESIIDHVQ